MVYMRLTDRTTAGWSPKGGEVKVTQRDIDWAGAGKGLIIQDGERKGLRKLIQRR